MRGTKLDDKLDFTLGVPPSPPTPLPQMGWGGGKVFNQIQRSFLKSTVLTILITSILLTATAFAQVPDKTREFVYGVNAFTGQTYQGTYYPRSVDTIYLIADIANVISPRESLVYFWPITNEYKVDWDGLNETVEGTLEVLQGREVIQTRTQTKYIIQYPNGLDGGQVAVYTGDQADDQYAEFDRQRKAFRKSVADYYADFSAYWRDLEEKQQAGTLDGDLPLPPEEPAPFLFFSTGVHDGFTIELPIGEYTIRLRDAEGQIIPDSRRNLVVFAPERDGVNYTIIPHDKWTITEESDDPGQIIYARSDSTLYLQPSTEQEFNALYYDRLEQPQSTTGNIDRWRWVPLQPIDKGTLEVVQGGQVVDRIARKAYVVRQYTGSALGYEIHDQATVEEERLRTRRPDFEAYAVTVAPEQATFSIRLVDADNNIVPGSERTVKLVKTQNASSFFILPILPLLLGVGVAIWRKEKLTNLQKNDQ